MKMPRCVTFACSLWPYCCPPQMKLPPIRNRNTSHSLRNGRWPRTLGVVLFSGTFPGTHYFPDLFASPHHAVRLFGLYTFANACAHTMLGRLLSEELLPSALAAISTVAPPFQAQVNGWVAALTVITSPVRWSAGKAHTLTWRNLAPIGVVDLVAVCDGEDLVLLAAAIDGDLEWKECTLPKFTPPDPYWQVGIRVNGVIVSRSAQFVVTADPRQTTGFVGLKNQGATCYLNSLLQSLFCLSYFRTAVYKIPVELSAEKVTIPLALQHLFYKLEYSEQAVSTKELTQSFGWDAHEAYVQHDVQELARVLLDNLEEKMKGTAMEGTIPKLFVGEAVNYITCVDVAHNSTRKEQFYDLQLTVRGCEDIYDSFAQYVKPERLDGDNKYCVEKDGVKSFHPADKGVCFALLPPVLVLHLARWEFDVETMDNRKVNTHYKFYPEICLSDYISSTDFSAADSSLDGSACTNLIRNSSLAQAADQYTYTLHSVLVHTGGTYGGHYYAFIRPENGPQWFKFNDSNVSVASEHQVFQQNFGGDTNSGSAYMLLYIRKSVSSLLVYPSRPEDEPTHLREHFEMVREDEKRKRQEKEEQGSVIQIRVVQEADIRSQGNVFDLVDTKKLEPIKVSKTSLLCDLRKLIEERTGIKGAQQQLWQFREQTSGNGSSFCRTFRPRRLVEGDGLQMTQLFAVNWYSISTVDLLLLQSECPVLPHQLLVSFKYFDPMGTPKLQYCATVLVDDNAELHTLGEQMRAFVGAPPTSPLIVFQEESRYWIPNLSLTASLRHYNVGHGCMLIFQTEADPSAEYPLASQWCEYMCHRQVVDILPLNQPTTVVATLELDDQQLCPEVCDVIGAQLGLDGKCLRLTSYNPSTEKPGIVARSTETLFYILSWGAVLTNRLYYEVLDTPLKELENQKSLTVHLFGSRVPIEILTAQFMLSKTQSVADALLQMKPKLEELIAEKQSGLSPSTERDSVLTTAIRQFTLPLRTLQLLEFNDYQNSATVVKGDTLMGEWQVSEEMRVEEIPEVPSPPTFGVKQMQVRHMSITSDQWMDRISFHSTPFFLNVAPHETAEEVLQRIKERLLVSEEDSASWHLHLVLQAKHYPLLGSDFVLDRVAALDNSSSVGYQQIRIYRAVVDLAIQHPPLPWDKKRASSRLYKETALTITG
eukprot:NODE_36_length_3924_cov_21.666316_g33_i0.p1 GENE.NODE_36_length_3924_cov_21.666316_g33_i0~~NODE_36_length_3924_cov_21.666316_g33_i0.p1  ORF type:complete len:1160 (+),score=335.29 NODE_36_length_3924_cov_21.666316_g33_i0:364-3843(+)